MSQNRISITSLFIIEESKVFHLKDSSSYTIPRSLRVEEIRYFDSKYQSEQRTSANNSIVNVNKYVYYRDVYIFVNRFKNLINQHSDNVKHVLTTYFRDFALM